MDLLDHQGPDGWGSATCWAVGASGVEGAVIEAMCSSCGGGGRGWWWLCRRGSPYRESCWRRASRTWAWRGHPVGVDEAFGLASDRSKATTRPTGAPGPQLAPHVVIGARRVDPSWLARAPAWGAAATGEAPGHPGPRAQAATPGRPMQSRTWRLKEGSVVPMMTPPVVALQACPAGLAAADPAGAGRDGHRRL